MMDPELPEANLGRCWHEGKMIVQQEEGLIIHETKASGESGNNANEPTYSVNESYETGGYGKNPWREK